VDLLHLLENTFDRKRISVNPKAQLPNPTAQKQHNYVMDEIT